jgi:hypothetical protein
MNVNGRPYRKAGHQQVERLQAKRYAWQAAEAGSYRQALEHNDVPPKYFVQ